MMRATVVAFGVFLAASCTAHSSPGRPQTGAPTGGVTGSSAPTTGLTGIGATIDEWNQSHVPDPDPRAASNCCYLPQVNDAERAGDDTWAAVMSDGGYVYSYERRFPEGTSTASAISALQAEDLPRDARLVRHALKASCNFYLYSSRTLNTLPPKSRAPFVLVTLLPKSTASRYSETNVVYADLDVWPNRSIPPC